MLIAMVAAVPSNRWSLGGTISGEHGIGHKRKPYLSQVMGPAQIEVLSAGPSGSLFTADNIY